MAKQVVENFEIDGVTVEIGPAIGLRVWRPGQAGGGTDGPDRWIGDGASESQRHCPELCPGSPVDGQTSSPPTGFRPSLGIDVAMGGDRK